MIKMAPSTPMRLAVEETVSADVHDLQRLPASDPILEEHGQLCKKASCLVTRGCNNRSL